MEFERNPLRFTRWNARIFHFGHGFWVFRTMRELLIRFALWVIVCLTLCWGVLSIFFQRTLRRFLEWYTRADKWSARDTVLESKISRSQQIAGIIAVLIGIMGAWFLLAGVRQGVGRPAAEHTSLDETKGNHGPVWIFGVGLILYGTYMIFKPEEYLRVIGSGFPNRRLNPAVTKQGKQLGRIIGIMQFVAGLYILFHWYIR